jgi:hypothetical protein
MIKPKPELTAETVLKIIQHKHPTSLTQITHIQLSRESLYIGVTHDPTLRPV